MGYDDEDFATVEPSLYTTSLDAWIGKLGPDGIPVNSGSFISKKGERKIVKVVDSIPWSWEEEDVDVTRLLEAEYYSNGDRILGKADIIVLNPMGSFTRDETKRASDLVAKETGRDRIMSVDELLFKMIPEVSHREVIQKRWVRIREQVIKKFEEKNHIITLGRFTDLLRNAEEWLDRARIRLQEGREADQIIFDSARAVEALLRITYALSRGKVEEQNFGELLDSLKKEIVRNYGEDILADMGYIREQRNIVAHPRKRMPDMVVAKKTYGRARLVYDIFMGQYRSLTLSRNLEENINYDS